jgi:hypothetical protein
MSVHGCWLVSDAYHRTQDQEQHVDKAQLSEIGAALARALDADTMMRMARTSGFCQRMRWVTPRELVVSVIAAMATQSTETIADVQRTFNALTGRKLAYKPFHKKLAKPGFAELMRMIVSHLLDELVTDALRPMHHSALSFFDDILLQDGSSFAIHAALAGVFPGRRTTISPAAVELHATMSLWSDQPLVLFVAPDTAGERDYLPHSEAPITSFWAASARRSRRCWRSCSRRLLQHHADFRRAPEPSRRYTSRVPTPLGSSGMRSESKAAPSRVASAMPALTASGLSTTT